MSTAYLALFGWPIIVLILFQRLHPLNAMLWSLVAGYLLLPERTEIDLPLLPAINKYFVPTVAALVAMVFVTGNQARARGGLQQTQSFLNPAHVLPGWIPKSNLIRFLLLLQLVGIICTVLTNRDVVSYGPMVLQGHRMYDILSMTLTAGVVILPALLARKFLGHPDAQRQMLIVVTIAASFYALLAYYELVMSPQLNRIVYGFHNASFIQTVRDGGWRPTLFLSHGLLVGIFFACATIGAIGYYRISTGADKTRAMMAAGFLAITTLLINSLGALMIAVLIAPLALLSRARLQLLTAAVVSGIILLYPMMRTANVVPVNKVVEFTQRIDVNRASSLAYRIENEDLLLAHAKQRPVFGWGRHGRSRVFNERGEDVGTTDGIWVIHIGVGGWVGYIAQFGFLTAPLIMLAFRRRGDPPTLVTTTIGLMLAANLIDMIPNASTVLLTYLMAGALIGRMEFEKVSQSDASETESDPAFERRYAYSRTPPRPSPRLGVRRKRAKESLLSHRKSRES